MRASEGVSNYLTQKIAYLIGGPCFFDLIKIKRILKLPQIQQLVASIHTKQLCASELAFCLKSPETSQEILEAFYLCLDLDLPVSLYLLKPFWPSF